MIQMNVFVFPQILVLIGLTHVLVVFRAIIAVVLTKGNSEFLRNNSSSCAMMLGAVLHYFIITVMTRVHRSLKAHLSVLSLIFSLILIMPLSLQINRMVAMKLCEIGEYIDESLILTSTSSNVFMVLF